MYVFVCFFSVERIRLVLTLFFIAVAEGATLTLAQPEKVPRSQRWTLSIDGYLVNGFEPSLVLTPQTEGENYKLALATHSTYKEEHRWGLLIPEFVVRNRVQILTRWSVAMLLEWRTKTGQNATMKPALRTAAWPEDEFFISTHDGYALGPEKAEAFAAVGLQKLDANVDADNFKWKYDAGCLVHVLTGLVLHSHGTLFTNIAFIKKCDIKQLSIYRHFG